MPKRAKTFIFCVHAHQPVGNFDNVFVEAYEKCYRPFFEVIERHPSFPLVCHFSGCLLDWLEANKPEFIAKLKKIYDRGQIEFLGGGYYEPIYGAIPKKDLEGQIRLTQERLAALFGAEAPGVWLTERVWDPDLVKPLKKAGVGYTVLDDFHFENAGLPAPITGYYEARQGTSKIGLFASMKQLRYLMPFRTAEDTLEFIHSLAAGPQDALVFADDCEKFGLWPCTYGWVYQQNWLEKLLKLLETDPQIRMTTFSRFRSEHKAKKTVRIPHASYSEMMEWSGGRFYNFFEKYPESRYMLDRMNQVSAVVQANGRDPIAHEKSRRALYMAQCNCSYWHGVFGGLYLHHLRSKVFENLIRAEHAVIERSRLPRLGKCRMPSGDRWALEQDEITSYFNPGYGGAMEELDYVPMTVNLMCNLQRHRETYHNVLSGDFSKGALMSIHQLLGTKEKNLEKHLFYDSHRRLSFMDHFFEKELTLEEFANSAYTESGDFVEGRYKARIRQEKNHPLLELERRGTLTYRGRRLPFRVKKTFTVKGASTVRAHYSVENLSEEQVSAFFGVEFNFSIGELSAMRGTCERRVRNWLLRDSWRGIKLRLASDGDWTLLTAPVETVSESESGLEKTFQELAILLQKEVRLRSRETREWTLDLEVR